MFSFKYLMGAASIWGVHEGWGRGTNTLEILICVKFPLYLFTSMAKFGLLISLSSLCYLLKFYSFSGKPQIRICWFFEDHQLNSL